MNDELDLPRARRDVIAIPSLWLAFALSLLLHLAVLWQWLPHLRFLPSDKLGKGEGSGPLQIRLVPPPSPAPLPPREARQSPQPQARRSPPPPPPSARVQPRPPPSAPKLALNAPGPGASAPAQPSAPAAPPQPPAPAAAAGDMASLIEARRRARGESEASALPVEDENARAKRIIAANLGTNRDPTFGNDPRRGGGVFQIMRLGYDDGEFMFFGWNRNIARNTAQMISVRKGNNPDIRIAIVRKMIEIIRITEKGDFSWESQRLGRNVTLSARMEDNSGLEEFMMREFNFDKDPRR